MFDSIIFDLNPYFGYSATFVYSICILCEFAILLDVHILLTPQEEEVHSSSCGNRCTHLPVHSSKRSTLCLSLYQYASVIHEKRLQDKLLHHCSSQCRLLIVIDELDPFHQKLHHMSTLRGSIVQHKQGIQLRYGGCYEIK